MDSEKTVTALHQVIKGQVRLEQFVSESSTLKDSRVGCVVTEPRGT